MPNIKRIEGGGKDKPKGNTYYDWDKNYNNGWLPGGADNPITSFVKGVLKITTGIDIPNPNKFKLENPEVKSWNDRNTNNADTKLSKEKPIGGPKKMPRVPGRYPNVKPKKPNR